MKKLFLILIAGFVMASCGTQTSQQAEITLEPSLIAELVYEPLSYEGKTVQFEGVISHICQHSGDKMRVVQTTDDTYSIQVMLMDYLNQFEAGHEGHEVLVTGVMRIEVRNIDELEDEHGDHDDHDGHDCASTEEAVKRLAERGIDPDIRPYVELTAFEIR